MTTTAKTWTEYKVTLHPDSDPESPREWENLGTMVYWHNRYTLGDSQPSGSPAEWARDLAADIVGADDPDLIPDEDVVRILDKHVCLLPVNAYEHGGITLSTGDFSCPWDSGQVGYIYLTLADARINWCLPGATWDTLVPHHFGREITIREYAREILTGEVETYDQYLTGDVYGYTLEEREVELNLFGEEVYSEWEETDSCWGFYGWDGMTNGMLEHLPEAAHPALEAAEVEYP